MRTSAELEEARHLAGGRVDEVLEVVYIHAVVETAVVDTHLLSIFNL